MSIDINYQLKDDKHVKIGDNDSKLSVTDDLSLELSSKFISEQYEKNGKYSLKLLPVSAIYDSICEKLQFTDNTVVEVSNLISTIVSSATEISNNIDSDPNMLSVKNDFNAIISTLENSLKSETYKHLPTSNNQYQYEFLSSVMSNLNTNFVDAYRILNLSIQNILSPIQEISSFVSKNINNIDLDSYNTFQSYGAKIPELSTKYLTSLQNFRNRISADINKFQKLNGIILGLSAGALNIENILNKLGNPTGQQKGINDIIISSSTPQFQHDKTILYFQMHSRDIEDGQIKKLSCNIKTNFSSDKFGNILSTYTTTDPTKNIFMKHSNMWFQPRIFVKCNGFFNNEFIENQLYANILEVNNYKKTLSYTTCYTFIIQLYEFETSKIRWKNDETTNNKQNEVIEYLVVFQHIGGIMPT